MKRKKESTQIWFVFFIIFISFTLSNQIAHAATTSGGQQISLPSSNNNFGNIDYGLMNEELAKIVLAQEAPLTYLNNLVTINQGGVTIYKNLSDLISGTNGSPTVATGGVNDVTYYLKNGGINVQTGEIFNLKIRFYTSDHSALSLTYNPNDPITSIAYPAYRSKAQIVWIEQTVLDSAGNAVPNLNWIMTSQLLISNEVTIFNAAASPILFNLERINLAPNFISEPASGGTMTADGYFIMGGTGSTGGYVPNQNHGNIGWSGGAFIKNKTTATLGIGTSSYVQETSPYLPTGHTGFVIPNTSFTVPYINGTKTLLEMSNMRDSYGVDANIYHSVGIMFPSIKPQKMIQYVAVDPNTGKKTQLSPSSEVNTIPNIPIANTAFMTPTEGPNIAGYSFKQLKIQDTASATGKGIFAHGYTYIEYQYVKNSRVRIAYQDENGNPIAPSEELKGNVGDSFDTKPLRKEIADYELIQIPTETGIYQNEETSIIYIYRKTIVTLHIKQVVLNASQELVIPDKGYLTINNVDQLKPEDVSVMNESVNISVPSKLMDSELSSTYHIIRSKTYDFYQVVLLLPEYYQSVGYVLTDAAVSHSSLHKEEGLPVLNGKNQYEYWLTLYIQPSVSTFLPYSWAY